MCAHKAEIIGSKTLVQKRKFQAVWHGFARLEN
jgi:hypothetical protein